MIRDEHLAHAEGSHLEPAANEPSPALFLSGAEFERSAGPADSLDATAGTTSSGLGATVSHASQLPAQAAGLLQAAESAAPGVEDLRWLRGLNDRLARGCSRAFSERLGTKVEIRLIGVERLEYRQFMLDIESPTCLAVLRVEPVDVPLALDWPPRLLFGLLDGLLGGQPRIAAIPQRPLTDIEQRLAGHLVRLWIQELRSAWRDIAPVAAVLDRWERYPHRAALAPLREPLVAARFRVSLGPLDELMTLAMPARMVDELPKAAATDPRLASERGWLPPADERRAVAAAADEPLVVCLTDTLVALADLESLRVGDVIATDHPIDARLWVLAGDEPRFTAEPGQARGLRAIRLHDVSAPGQEVERGAAEVADAPPTDEIQR